ncbi:GDSL-type esterase/lipase family protein [Streptococcus orisratti]|uniref:GDSL-type esterase/lipase family protein n=1 Tax=Streptococcus orisratti TaxID=114652 RepID=UPI003D021119
MTDFQELYHKADVQEYRQYILTDQQNQLWEKYAALNKIVSHPNIVFAGDSITEFFPIHELLTSDTPLYNRGIHGIDSLQLLEHLSSQILELAPSKVFLLVGVNDLKKRAPEEVCQTIQSIITKIHQQLPETLIFLLSIFPMNESPEFVRTPSLLNNQSISLLNDNLSRLAGEKVSWLDVHDLLCDETGQLKRDWTVDGLHLTVAGYRVIADAIQPYLV